MSDSPRFASSPAKAALLDALLRAQGHETGSAPRIPRRAAAEAPVVTRRQEFIGTVSYAYLRRAQRRLSRPAPRGRRRAR